MERYSCLWCSKTFDRLSRRDNHLQKVFIFCNLFTDELQCALRSWTFHSDSTSESFESESVRGDAGTDDRQILNHHCARNDPIDPSGDTTGESSDELEFTQVASPNQKDFSLDLSVHERLVLEFVQINSAGLSSKVGYLTLRSSNLDFSVSNTSHQGIKERPF
jgi:hypothetical protein